MPLWQLNNPISIGKIVKTNGYLGKFKVAFVFLGTEQFLKKDGFIFIQFQEKNVPFQILEINHLSEDEALISLEFVNSELEAKNLVGKEIFLPKKEIPGKFLNAHKDKDLTSFCISINGMEGVFEIIHHEETPNYPLIEALVNGKEVTIPLPDTFIIKKDLKKRIIHLDLPEGLLDQ